MMRGRMGRPGLLGTMARTAVISGTATAVAGNVQRRQMQRAAEDRATAAPPPPPPPSPTASPAPSDTGDRIAQLRELADLRAQGVLTEEEFAAEKARVLGA